jgi:hypothetical protein
VTGGNFGGKEAKSSPHSLVKKSLYMPTEKFSMALLNWLHSLQGSPSLSPHGHESTRGRGEAPQQITLGLRRGGSVAADFFRVNGKVHTLCHVDKYSDGNLRLRIVSEVGTVSMMGLKVGTAGQLEADNRIFPFQVVHVALPVVDITVFLSQARPVKRQFLRIPVSCPVRLRQSGSTGPWKTGKTLDVSAGGCGFAFASPHLPALGTPYDLELILDISPHETEQLTMMAEVRWVKRVAGEVHVGAEVTNPAQRRVLATVVTRLQQTMSRRPDDYLLT